MSEGRDEVVARLGALEFGAGSHENLSMLAHAIVPRAYGWNASTCEQVRARLVALLTDGGPNEEELRAVEAERDALRRVVDLDTSIIAWLRENVGAV